MKRRKMSYNGSKRHFRKNTGVQAMNKMKPQHLRGGIRL
nr:MAG: hypothetical protein [Microvirus sp.]